MKTYSNKISLTKNSRGIYCIDTSIGCSSGMNNNEGGCYNDCYAAKSAKIYGYDFSQTILRHFENRKHELEIIYKISRVKLDFIRIGCSGDPSENWQHCIDILKIISKGNKEMVIITKHWTLLTTEQLNFLSKINVCINTSVSALDKPELLEKCLVEYNRIKYYCKSVLRIVSCDFNIQNEEGKRLNDIQHNLFKNDLIIDTVFRPSKNNRLITDGVINVKSGLFNGNKQIMSKFNKKTFLGKCAVCPQMCGVSIKDENKIYPIKPGTIKQAILFKLK